MKSQRLTQVNRILGIVLVLNALVATVKLGYGITIGSLGMQADGMHSFFDGISNVVGLIGIWLATSPPDDEHPYGHKKYEALAAGLIGAMLIGTAAYIFWGTFQSFGRKVVPQVTTLSFVVMIATMTINAGVSRWEYRKGKELRSEVLLADSYHTASDFFTSLSVLAGLLAVHLGYPFVDPIIAVIIGCVIAWTAWSVLREVSTTLTDQIRLKPEVIREVVLSVPGVLDCYNVRSRGLAHNIFVDLSIHVRSTLSIGEAHEIADRVETVLMDCFAGIEDVLVHVEPEKNI